MVCSSKNVYTFMYMYIYIYIHICVCVFENKYLCMHLVDRWWFNLNLVEVCRIYRWFRFCGFKSLGMRHDDRDDQKGECARIGPKVSQTNWFLTHLLPTFALPAIEKMHLRANHATQQDLRGILLGAQRSKAKSTVKVCVCV